MSVEEFREFVIVLCFMWMWFGGIVGSGLTMLWLKRDRGHTKKRTERKPQDASTRDGKR